MKKRLSIIGIPSDFGANKIGARYAPNRIRKYLIPFLKKYKIPYIDYNNIRIPKSKKIRNPKKKHFKEIKRVCHNFLIKEKCSSKDCFPIILGGDHTITGCIVEQITIERKLGLIYFDAHGDFNTPKTTPSGNIHGMMLHRITGGTLMDIMDIKKAFIQQKNIAMIGVRDLDPEEKILLKKSNITIFTADDVKKQGIERVTKRAIKIASRDTEGFHLSIDMDVVDPKFAPGVSTPIKNGITKSQIIKAIKIISKSNIVSADFVEVNPKYDIKDKTSKLVVELIKNLL